ncbi:hypothetical protein KY289_001279 [Solanum tuberosum]|nr:hypothetical protein KY289_001279 [Solanum tuberosum]
MDRSNSNSLGILLRDLFQIEGHPGPLPLLVPRDPFPGHLLIQKTRRKLRKKTFLLLTTTKVRLHVLTFQEISPRSSIKIHPPVPLLVRWSLPKKINQVGSPCLRQHIAKHFIGETKLFQDRSLQILNNLTCPNLDSFIPYKHAFLNKVMIRPDCHLDFWKERFISGLSPLVTDKVRTKIQDRNDGRIPYSSLTYGDLVRTINIVGLELCTDIKLKHQLKKEQSSSRRELGSFYRDFGFITPPDKVKKDKKEKKSQKKDDSTRPKRKKSRSKRPRDAKIEVCWTCGKTGHKANECRYKTKKKINLLNIDEETKDKLLAILDEPFSETSGTSDEYSDDEEINLDYETDASQSGKDCTCTEAFCSCDSTPQIIRVLSNHSKEALFDVIQHIADNEARNCFLLELKNIILNTAKPKSCPVVEPFSMKQIMSHLESHFEPSISDLRHEVSNSNKRLEISNLNWENSKWMSLQTKSSRRPLYKNQIQTMNLRRIMKLT